MNNKKVEPPPPPQNYLSIDELIVYLPVSYTKNTIYNMVNKKEIPYKKFGKNLLFSTLEIDKWITDKIQ